GGNDIDPRIADACSMDLHPADWEALHFDDRTRERLKRLSDALFEKNGEPKKSAMQHLDEAGLGIVVHGPGGTPFLPITQVFSRSRNPLVVDLALARGKERDWEDFVRRCYREAYLLQKPIIWHQAELLLTAGQTPEHLET